MSPSVEEVLTPVLLLLVFGSSNGSYDFVAVFSQWFFAIKAFFLQMNGTWAPLAS